MYTIKAAADFTGVPVATLRAWERRYGVAQPGRTDSGYRLYDERALGEIRTMHTLIDAGWAPRQAADEVLRRRDGITFDTVAELHTGVPAPEALVDAARSLDESALASILDAVFTRASFEHVFEAWLTPALRLIGEAWTRGELDISAEHVVSEALMRRLAALYESTGSPRGPRVLVGLPSGGEHALPALAFAVAARRAGVSAMYLGVDVPADAWITAISTTHARAIVVSVTTPADAASAAHAIPAIAETHPGVCIAVGGACAAAVPGATITLEGGVPESVRRLVDTLDRTFTKK